MRKALFFLVPVLFILSGCGNTFRVYHDLDPETDFSQYKTYSFLDFTDGNKKTITGMELERIRTAFARELESMGFHYMDGDSDLKVKITVYFREKRDFTYGFYFPSSYNYIERALAVDIFEGSSKKHVWHSAAVGEVARTPEKRAEELPAQVQGLFQSFPVTRDA